MEEVKGQLQRNENFEIELYETQFHLTFLYYQYSDASWKIHDFFVYISTEYPPQVWIWQWGGGWKLNLRIVAWAPDRSMQASSCA